MTVTTGPTTPLATRPPGAVVGVEMEHESAALHVTGHALYTDDLVGRTGRALHAHPVQAPHTHARVTALRADPAYDVPGVVRVLTAADVPGINDAGVKHDEPLFPDEVMYHGHPVAWVLGETLEAARRGAAAVEVDYEPLPSLVTVTEAIAAGSFQGFSPVVERGDVDAALGLRGARLRGRHRDGRTGALLPRDARVARAGRRGRPGLRAVQHPAPDRDPGDRRPRARPAEQRGHRAVPADGGRLRGQGDAAARLRRDRGARQHPHRPPGAAAPDPHPGHHHDRQATRLPRHVARGLRRRRSPAGAGGHAHLRRRLEPRPVRAGAGPGAVPRRQRLLDPARPRARSDRQDPQDLADGLPRLRRPPGDAGGRGRPGSLRTPARARPGRAAAAQLLRRGPGHAVRPAGAARRADWSPRGTRSPRPATSRPGVPRSPPSTTTTRTPSARWP